MGCYENKRREDMLFGVMRQGQNMIWFVLFEMVPADLIVRLVYSFDECVIYSQIDQ